MQVALLQTSINVDMRISDFATLGLELGKWVYQVQYNIRDRTPVAELRV